MAGEAEDQEKEEFVVVGDGADEELENSEEEESEEKKKGSDDDSDDDNDDNDDSDDDELGHDEEADDDDDKSGKGSRREQNRNRRARIKAAKERSEREMNFLRKRNADLEKRFSELDSRIGNTEIASVGNHIKKLEGDLALADDVMAQAMDSNNSKDFIEAQNIRDELRDEIARAKYHQQQLQSRGNGGARNEGPDPRMVELANDFVSSKPWLDLQGRDKDSQTVTRLDNQLVREGYDPSTEEYWEELEARVRDELPHHYKQASNDGDEQDENPTPKPKKKGKGPKMSAGGRERTLKKNEVYINKERRQAMEEAGVWDDPVLRQRYLKQYAEFDKANASRN